MNTHKIVGMWTIMLILCLGIATATDYYYNSTTGNDGNNCTTPALACKTLEDLRGLSWKANTTFYLNGCEEPYRGWMAKDSQNNATITFTSYGGCGNARIYGSVNQSSASNWTDMGDNKWQTTLTYLNTLGIWFNTSGYGSNVVNGQNTTAFANVDAPYEYWYNATSKKIVVYATANPVTYYGNIEVGNFSYTSATDHPTFFLGNSVTYAKNLTIRNLDFAFTRGSAISLDNVDDVILENVNLKFVYWKGLRTDRVDNLTVRNNTFYTVGIRGYDSPEGLGAQGENLYLSRGTNVNVLNNTIDKCGGVCINYWHGSGSNTSYNIIVNPQQELSDSGNWAAGIYYDGCNNSINTYNYVSGAKVGLQVGTEVNGFKSINHTFSNNIVLGSRVSDFLTDNSLTTGLNITNIVIDHNTFIKTDNYTGSAYGRQIQFQNYENVTFTNNIVYNNYTNATYGYLLWAENGTSGTGLISNYNSYFSNVGRFYYYFGSTAYASLASWLTTGKDANSLGTNPELNLTSFKPVYDSVACTASSTGSYVGALPCEAEPDPPIIISNPSAGESIADVVNVTWDYLGNTSVFYDVYLLNNDSSVNKSIVDSGTFSNTNVYFTACTYAYNLITTLDVDNLVDNVTLFSYVQGSNSRVVTDRIVFAYDDGSTYSVNYAHDGFNNNNTYSNPSPYLRVENIKVYQYCAYSDFSVLLEATYNTRHEEEFVFVDLFGDNLVRNTYGVNITVLNDSGYITSASQLFFYEGNAELNLSLYNLFNSTNINYFSVSVVNKNDSSISYYSTSNGSIKLRIARSDYLLSFDVDEGSFDSFSYNYTLSDTFSALNISLYPTNTGTVFLIYEGNNSFFNCTAHGLTSCKLYLGDSDVTIFDFKTSSSFNYSFALDNATKFRLELLYPSFEVVTRYYDLAVVPNRSNVRLCANPINVTHYEMILYSASKRAVALVNPYSDCIVGADYTRFAYQDAFILRTLTIDMPYYLYLNSGSSQTFLVGIDGSVESFINVDTLEFRSQAFDVSIKSDSLTVFSNTSNLESIIYYINYAEDNTKANISIYGAIDGVAYLSGENLASPNNFTLLFDYSTINVVNNSLFEIVFCYTGLDGSSDCDSVFFDVNSGLQGEGINSNLAFMIAVVLVVFGFTMTQSKTAFGWFGIIMLFTAEVVLAFSPMTWYIRAIMGVVAIYIVFVAFVMPSKSRDTILG